MPDRTFHNPEYVWYESLLRRLHELSFRGEDQSEEADQIREEMSFPFRRLTEQERVRLQEISGDLFMLEGDLEGEEVYEPAPPEDRTPDGLGDALLQAWKAGEWETVLKLLRRGPEFLPLPLVAHMRDLAFHALGHLDIARLFAIYVLERDSEIAALAPDGVTAWLEATIVGAPPLADRLPQR